MKYTKSVLADKEFYISKFTHKEANPYLLFVHGGPGANCGAIEYLIEKENFFEKCDFNLIFYDQRGCGRSTKYGQISHDDNLKDLEAICIRIGNMKEIKLAGFIGHSYGAKLLFDFCVKMKTNFPVMLVSTAKSIITPRIHNILLDLVYLKEESEYEYKALFNKMESFSWDKLWSLTEEMAHLFQKNTRRAHFYWANLETYEKYMNAQMKSNLPLESNVFACVRKSLYTGKDNFLVELDNISNKCLVVNGFHDYIMDGAFTDVAFNSKSVTFYQSAHFPHIEQNEKFCETVNVFFKSL